MTSPVRAEEVCNTLLDRTTPVSFPRFALHLAQTMNIHPLVAALESAHGGLSFRIPLAAGRTLYILQERDLIRDVMTSQSKLPFVNRNFDASHGHFRSINSVNTTDPLWKDLHDGLAGIFERKSIIPILEKHRPLLTSSVRLNLNDVLEEFYLKVWGEYCFGPLEYPAFKATRDKLVAVLGKVFHENRVNRLPYAGALTSRLNRVRYREELRQVDAELTQILESSIAHRQGVFFELYEKLKEQHADAFEITRDNSFLAILVYDFIHIVMLDTLAHIAESPDVDRKKQFLESRHNAFLYPFRFRIVEEDHHGFKKGDFVVVNLQKSGLYFSAGARFCPGAKLFGEVSRWTLEALAGYDLRLVDPGQLVVRSENRDLPFLLSTHDVEITGCPHLREKNQ